MSIITPFPRIKDPRSFRTVWLAFGVHSGGLSEPGIPQGMSGGICPELALEETPMNRVLHLLCFAVLGACVTNRTQADDPASGGQFQSLTASNSTLTTMSVVGTQGAMVIEASTNLTDWMDVTMLFPNNGTGIFIDTESTNYSSRFYRVRTIMSAANNMITVNSIADLRMLSAVSGNADIGVRGFSAFGDGGGGQFYWDPNSTEPENNGITVVPSSNPPSGRWKRNYQGAVNVKWFGAAGDGATIDLPAIQAALDFVDGKGGGKVFLPRGVYLLGDERATVLQVGDNTLIEGEGPGTVIVSNGPEAIRNRMRRWPNNGGSNITVQNLAIDCNGRGKNGITYATVTDGTIHNVTIKNPQGYGVWLVRDGDNTQEEGKPTKRVTVSNCHITGVVDVGIECSGAVGCTIVGNTVTGTRGPAGFYAWNGATDCVFTGNVAEGEGLTNKFVGFEVQPSDPYTCPVPAAKRTQTQRISFVGNVARNVAHGMWVYGGATNKPTDVLIQGNSFFGLGHGDRGIEIERATRVNIHNNLIDGFECAIMMNDTAAGYELYGASYVSVDNNVFKGGAHSQLFGNLGGSFNGNRFFNQTTHAARLYAWKNCTISENLFVNLGTDQDSLGLILCAYNSIGMIGNIVTGNKSMDDRDVKWTAGTIGLYDDGHDRNVITGNSADGAKLGAKAFSNFGSSTNNIVANNIDG